MIIVGFFKTLWHKLSLLPLHKKLLIKIAVFTLVFLSIAVPTIAHQKSIKKNINKKPTLVVKPTTLNKSTEKAKSVAAAPKVTTPPPPAPSPTSIAPTPKSQPSTPSQPAITKPVPATMPSPGSTPKALTPNSSQTTTSSTSGSGSTSTTTSNNTPPPASGGYTSTNWSGYVATSGGYNNISGNWQVPTVSGNGQTTSGDSSWIGIGGVYDSDLIQVGTTDNVSPTGQVNVSAFYELLPNAAIEIPSLTVSAGDNMSASLNQSQTNIWQIAINDLTSGKSYTTTVNYTSQLSSAEWIEEDPSYQSGGQVPLDNFGSVVFSNGDTLINGVEFSIGADQSKPITMVNSSNQPIAVPSILSNNGQNFTISQQSN